MSDGGGGRPRLNIIQYQHFTLSVPTWLLLTYYRHYYQSSHNSKQVMLQIRPTAGMGGATLLPLTTRTGLRLCGRPYTTGGATQKFVGGPNTSLCLLSLPSTLTFLPLPFPHYLIAHIGSTYNILLLCMTV